MTRLFHYSEESSIDTFHPRPSKHHDGLPLVWAVKDTEAEKFLLPRDCPRVTCRVAPHTSQEDAARWFGATTATRIVAIESAWIEQVRSCTLYEYEMPPETFVQADTDPVTSAGYWISRETVVPLRRRVITDVLGELLLCTIELRVMPNLWLLSDQVAASTLGFSMIRMANALPRP